MSGSISEIIAWNSALSISRFRQHVFNKFSTTGNSIASHEKELIYHFKLAENYTSASVSASNQTLTIIDSAPKCSALLTTNYSFQKTGSLFIGSNVYGFDMVDVITFGFNDNAELVNARVAMIGFLMLILTELAFGGEPATLKIFGIS